MVPLAPGVRAHAVGCGHQQPAQLPAFVPRRDRGCGAVRRVHRRALRHASAQPGELRDCLLRAAHDEGWRDGGYPFRGFIRPVRRQGRGACDGGHHGGGGGSEQEHRGQGEPHGAVAPVHDV